MFPLWSPERHPPLSSDKQLQAWLLSTSACRTPEILRTEKHRKMEVSELQTFLIIYFKSVRILSSEVPILSSLTILQILIRSEQSHIITGHDISWLCLYSDDANNQNISDLSRACDPPNHDKKAPNLCLDVLLSALYLRLRNFPAAAKLLTLKMSIEVNCL